MKKVKVLVVALALLALVAGTAQAEMFVEGYLGGNFASSSPNSISRTPPGLSFIFTRGNYRGNIDPALMGGLKLGAFFEQSGVLSGINFPSWMKYLGFYLDFCYHRLDFPERTAGSWFITTGQQTAGPFGRTFKSEGGAATLAFMFAFRYGFLPDKEVPFGRLQPYLAIGPAILFSFQQPTGALVGTPGPDIETNFDSKHSTDIALAAEAGIRWMCLKNVSVDVAFKYRHAQPTYNYRIIGFPGTLRFSPTYNLFSVIVGAAYHF